MKNTFFSLIFAGLCLGATSQAKAATCTVSMVDSYTRQTVQRYQDNAPRLDRACNQAQRQCQQDLRNRFDSRRYQCVVDNRGGWNDPRDPWGPNRPGRNVTMICHVERFYNQGRGGGRHIEIHEASATGRNDNNLRQRACSLAMQRCQSVAGYGQQCRYMRHYLQ